MNKQDTLVILSPGFPADEADSACLPAQQVFVNSLKKNFPQLRIIIFAFQYPYVKSKYWWYGNEVISFNGKNKIRLRRLSLWLSVWKTLRRLQKENNIIGLLSFWCGECAFIGKYFGKVYHIKFIGWITGQDAKKGNRYITVIRPEPAEIVALSDFLANEFYKNYKVRTSAVIPNGIDPNLFGKPQKEKDIDILGAGSLIPLKQYNIFIEVIAAIRKSFPSLCAMLCGDGPEKTKLADLIEKNDLGNNFLFAGEIPHKEVLQTMQRSKIFLHTSSYEGFSTVCLEALYAGAHVISFCKPMHREIAHWHIVSGKEEMIDKAFQLLYDPSTEYESILAYSMDESARTMMKLFGVI